MALVGGRVRPRRRVARRGGVAAAVGLVDLQLAQVPVEELHVADVAREADDGRAGEGPQALDVAEAGEGAVGGEVVGGEDDAVLELEAEDRGARHGGRLRVGLGGRVVEVAVVVGAVDVVAGTAPGLWAVIHGVCVVEE